MASTGWSKEALIALIGPILALFCTIFGLVWRWLMIHNTPIDSTYRQNDVEMTVYEDTSTLNVDFTQPRRSWENQSQSLFEIRRIQQERYSELLELRRGTF